MTHIVVAAQTQPQNDPITSADVSDQPIVYASQKAPKGLQPSSLWQRLQEGYQLSTGSNPDSYARIDSIILRNTRNPDNVLRITKRARPYLYHIVNALEKRNMPMEIALLPIVESRYNPLAYSPGRASGIWQFIPATGRYFGLEQNWWYDGRRDIVASTEAALNYLAYLNKRFHGDWLLSLAAYNAGEGTILKAMRSNRQNGKATDYWSLSLSKETSHYVPKLLAWAAIIKNPERYQLTLSHIPDTPYFTMVDIGSQIGLAEAATMANVNIDDLRQLNPGYKRWATDPKPPHYLAVPVSRVATLNKALTAHPVDQRISWQHYTINDGDSLIRIAKKFGITVNLLKTVNKIKTHRIQSGKRLIVPSVPIPAEYYANSFVQLKNSGTIDGG